AASPAYAQSFGPHQLGATRSSGSGAVSRGAGLGLRMQTRSNVLGRRYFTRMRPQGDTTQASVLQRIGEIHVEGAAEARSADGEEAPRAWFGRAAGAFDRLGAVNASTNDAEGAGRAFERGAAVHALEQNWSAAAASSGRAAVAHYARGTPASR